MDTITAGLLLLFILILSWLTFGRSRTLPPGPMSFPFLGSLPFLKELKNRPIPEVVLEARKKYGDIFSFRFGRQLFVVLNGYELIHQALVRQADACSGRPNFLKGLQPALKTGKGVLFQSYNHKWKTVRRFSLQTLRDFGVGKTSLEEKIHEENGAIANVLYSMKGEPVDISELLQKAAGNIIHGIVFGKRFNFGDPECLKTRRMLNRIFAEGPGFFNPVSFYPAWVIFFMKEGKRINEMFERNVDDIFAFFHEQIKDHEDTYDEHNIRDFTDLYIQASRRGEDTDGDCFTKGNMLRVMMDFFVAGSETSSTALSWALLLMSEFPNIQRKCQEEITKMIGDKSVTYSDRDKLLYVEATLRESLRYITTAPFGVAHTATDDTVLNGYSIPKNTIILPNLVSANMDQQYWTNPHQFQPDRFLNKDGKLIRNEAFIPFSIGPRTCLGEPLARMELFLIFTSLLQRFTFHREDEKKPHSLKCKPTNVTNQPEPFRLRVQSRTESVAFSQ